MTYRWNPFNAGEDELYKDPGSNSEEPRKKGQSPWDVVPKGDYPFAVFAGTGYQSAPARASPNLFHTNCNSESMRIIEKLHLRVRVVDVDCVIVVRRMNTRPCRESFNRIVD
jgi:hypothetical protein